MSQGLHDPKATDAKEVSEKILQRRLEETESFCLSNMPCAQDSMHLCESESFLSPEFEVF